MATTVEDSKALAASGVDAIVAQGGEAGGHRSVWVGAGEVVTRIVEEARAAMRGMPAELR